MNKLLKKTKDKFKGNFLSLELRSGGMRMIEKMAWNTFKNTGNINTFLELREFENIENNINGELYEDNKNQGDSAIRK